ncbi:hypothetical protein HK100_010342 [Physocladia obscura]|uniref:Guanine nucleotide-binding protein subunit beta-like protein n=1 Tax=Physocladia obscura TaxID=109957 RepID=A0AAD5T562_9FUNG|nr:hypothetical protein HK100_010342 [Physocladia obscura]
MFLLRERQTRSDPWTAATKRLFSRQFASYESGFEHSRTLRGHSGCVNTLAFDGDGRMLATGGDDCAVLIWNAVDLLTPSKPVASYSGHYSNIFSIAFGSYSNILYSCGNDGLLVRYDISRAGNLGIAVAPESTEVAHESFAALKLSICPKNDNIVLTSGQDGSIALWDMRCSSRRLQGRISSSNCQNCVTFNPTMPDLFLSSDDAGHIILRDLRMSGFENSDKKLYQYVTQLCETSRLQIANPIDTTSVVFSPCGKMFAATMQKWRPTLYSTSDSFPIAIFKSESDGLWHKSSLSSLSTARVLHGYSSSCTIKSGAFGDSTLIDYLGNCAQESMGSEHSSNRWYIESNEQGGGGLVFSVGSDDRRAYVWEVPKVSFLMDRRTQCEKFTEWSNASAIIYADNNGKSVKPFEICKEAYSIDYGALDDMKKNKTDTQPRKNNKFSNDFFGLVSPESENDKNEDLQLVIIMTLRDTLWRTPTEEYSDNTSFPSPTSSGSSWITEYDKSDHSKSEGSGEEMVGDNVQTKRKRSLDDDGNESDI